MDEALEVRRPVSADFFSVYEIGSLVKLREVFVIVVVGSEDPGSAAFNDWWHCIKYGGKRSLYIVNEAHEGVWGNAVEFGVIA